MLVGHEAFCDYRTIQEAVDALERRPQKQMDTLYILSGLYEENVRIYRSDLTVIGLGQVEIRGSLYARQLGQNGREIGTFGTPTLFLGGSRLTVENITVSNTAGQGEGIGQAVAVYAHCDEAVFRNCAFKGYQDTLFTGPFPPATKEGRAFEGVPLKEEHDRCRQLYLHCYIEGTVDFIFGGAAAWFEECEIRSLKHWGDGPGYITAASTPREQRDGYVFSHCYLTAEEGVNEVYLGRPWREYAKTDFVNCIMGSHIHPLGWDNWGNPANESTVRYREYSSRFESVHAGVRRADWTESYESDQGGPHMKEFFSGSNFYHGGGSR